MALVVGLVVAVLVGALATRTPATQRVIDSPLVGELVPDVRGTTISGDRFSLTSSSRSWRLVNFFATWCVPCIEEHDDLDRLDRGGRVEVVSVVFSDSLRDVRRFFARRGGEWPVLRDPQGLLATAFGVARVPESYLIAPNDVVVGKVTGGVTDDFVLRQIQRLDRSG